MDFGLDQYSCKGKGSGCVILIWDGWLDAAVSISFLLSVVSISESRHFVCTCKSYVSPILFKCCNSKNLILFVCGDGMAVCTEQNYIVCILGNINYVLKQILYWTSLKQHHFTLQ